MKAKAPFVWLIIAIAAPLAAIFVSRTLCCSDCNPPAQSKAAGLTPVQTELKAVMDRMRAKLEPVDEATEALLKDEIAALDAIVAKHKAGQPDDAAEVLVSKARVYQSYLDNPDAAIAIFRQIKTDFPTTIHAAKADEYIARAEARKVRMAARDSLIPGVTFPAFSAQDIDGNPLSLEQYRGKIVLVDFWATWCPPCREEMPHVIAAYQKYQDKGFEVIGISLDKSLPPLRDYIRKNAMVWRQVCDEKSWDGALVAKYGVLSIPTTFLLDAEGRIVAKNLRGDELDKQIEKLLRK